MFQSKLGTYPAVAVGSGTDSLHLAYILAGITDGDEVISPVFTCTATNIPLLYQRAKIVFADIQADTLNIDPIDVARKITDKTKAVVCVHYAGLPCDMTPLQEICSTHGIPLIEDAAHAIGAKYHGVPIGGISDYTCYSFQAIKTITTADGGMLTIKNPALLDKARRLRWFGLERRGGFRASWSQDITEVGYKYQMTDLSAAMGKVALEELEATLDYRRRLFTRYSEGLANIPGITVIKGKYNYTHGVWILTVLVENREDLMKKLTENEVENSLVHYRNDQYSIFGGRRDDLPNMDRLESKYLVLPLHMDMTLEDVDNICKVVKEGW
jgi:dTDP-4-amino-4,6-dideoxygalactose transaminase